MNAINPSSATKTIADGRSASPNWLSGVVPPVITPFTDAGEVDRSALAALVEHLIDVGVNGLFALGSSAETAYLTDAQRREVLTTIVDTNASRLPVLAGCIDTTAARVIEQALMAKEGGVDGIVATGPFYAINDATEVADHFRRIHAAVDLPLLAYDVPVRVHLKLAPATLVTLGREGVLVGVKDSSGDDISFRRLILANRAAGSPLALLSGHELVCDAMLMIGADGLVPGLGNVDPDGYVRLYRAALAEDWDSAVREQERLTTLFEIVFTGHGRSVDASGIGAFKAAMVVLGLLPNANMAAPVVALSAEHQDAVRRIVLDWQG